jgi:hypothetical protein
MMAKADFSGSAIVQAARFHPLQLHAPTLHGLNAGNLPDSLVTRDFKKSQAGPIVGLCEGH